MPDNTTIAALAFDLLSIAPDNAGFTLILGGGAKTWEVPQTDPLGMSPLLARAGIAPRPGQHGFTHDIHVYVDANAQGVRVRIERIIGIAHMHTLPDPAQVLASFQSGTLKEAESELVLALDKNFPGVALQVRSLFYRKHDFATCVLPDEPPPVETKSTFFRRWTITHPYPAFAEFVNWTIDRALWFGAPTYSPGSISLWFSFVERWTKELFVTVDWLPDGRRHVNITDWIAWPWRGDVVQEVVRSDEDLKAVVGGYILREYGFTPKEWRAYLSYTIANPAR